MYLAVGIDFYNALHDWGYYDISFKEALEILPDFVKADADTRNALIFDNLRGIIPFACTAFLSVWQVKKDGQLKNRAIKLM